MSHLLSANSQQKNKPARKLKLWRLILFIIIILVLTSIALELLVSWGLNVFKGYDGKHLIQYEFDPYKNILPTRNYADRRGIQHNYPG